MLKSAARVAHQGLCHSHALSRAYLRSLGAVAKAMPDGGWKNFVANSLQETTWPEVALPTAAAVYPGGQVVARLVPHLGEFDFQLHLSRHLAYEPEVFHWLNGRQYATILEVGANVGVFSLFLAKRFPQAKVYCFEPSRLAFSRLLANLAANPEVDNLYPYNCAIYDTAGFLTFHEPVGHLTNGSFHADFAGQFAATKSTFVPAMTPAALEPLLAQTPILVKIDVEGAEPELLQSLEPLLRKHQPDLIIEVLPTVEKALNDLAWLRDLYRLYSLQPAGPQERASFASSNFRDYALLPR
jgi:FkbM family methyltransferase